MEAPLPDLPPPTGVRVQRAAFVFIFITVVLDMLALGIIIPVLPPLIVAFEGGDLVRAARITGYFGTIWAAMQFVFSPLLGSLSDRFGRRPIILLSNFGLGLDYVLMAMAPSIPYLFIGRILSGITTSSFSTASAYIADVTPPDKRAARFGMLGAAFGLGFIIGPAIGGWLGGISLRLPFWVAAGLSLANAAYGFFVLPESLPEERRSAFSWKSANPIGSLKLFGSSSTLFSLAGAALVCYLANEVFPSIYVLYTGHRYQWSQHTVGLTLALVGIISAVMGGGLVGPIVKRLGERRAFLVGMLGGMVGCLAHGLAPTGSWFVVSLLLGAPFDLANPTMQSLMTEELPPEVQGQLQGALSSLRGLTGMVGPILFTQLFAGTLGEGVRVPGLPFYVAAVLIAVGATVGWRATQKRAVVETVPA